MKQITCPIASIDWYNEDTRRILLDLPAGEDVTFHAGQYLQMVLPQKKCPFSIASAPHLKGQLELHIRPTPGSEDSAIIEELLDNAREIEIQVPLGDCFLTEKTDNPLILLAASTGITQMKSIVEYLEPEGFDYPVYLYWGVLSDKDLYLAELCQSWADKHENFHFIPVVSEPDTSPDWTGRTGLVGEAALEDIEDVSNATVFVSGGPAMVYATLDAFMARGMPEENMKSDIFSYAPRS
ncbi:MAG: NAD(P)H-flavin reductase [Pseudomonadales bacterium]|nr:NAD(P)H-flavin reductase [Pseudomonadales bacterium]